MALIGLLFAAPAVAGIRLVPVLSGLTNPLFVTNAHDGTKRLFIVEQGGVIKVLQPGATSATTFLDISDKVEYGGDNGLHGLAFHPEYATNGLFYVNYTRAPDAAAVVAQYQVFSSNPNLVSGKGIELLVITQPYGNHKGGMMDFGADGYLYISTGDSGGYAIGVDPQNSGQDIEQLLGKILRIDVDHPNSPALYSSPASNPFVGKAGADEVFAYGFRNPWRFSFDRAIGTLYVADVGEDQREEVDTVAAGGNYGWRVWEGSRCTGLAPDPSCTGTGYTVPVIEYDHKRGRCSITGGYVYRGTQQSVPVGSYVFGDFCTGEIFQVANDAMSVLLNTTMAISSFGEDEAGEIYVVDLNGAVSRIAPPCTYAISPTSANLGPAGGTELPVSVAAPSECGWTAVSNDPSWLHVTSGASGSSNGVVRYSVDAYTAKPKFRSGTITIAGKTFSVKQGR